MGTVLDAELYTGFDGSDVRLNVFW